MALVFISLNVFLIADLGIFSVFSRIFMKGVWMDALVLAGMTIIGFTFQPLLIKLLING